MKMFCHLESPSRFLNILESTRLMIKIANENPNVIGFNFGRFPSNVSTEAPNPTKAIVPGIEPSAVARIKGKYLIFKNPANCKDWV